MKDKEAELKVASFFSSLELSVCYLIACPKVGQSLYVAHKRVSLGKLSHEGLFLCLPPLTHQGMQGACSPVSVKSELLSWTGAL